VILFRSAADGRVAGHTFSEPSVNSLGLVGALRMTIKPNRPAAHQVPVLQRNKKFSDEKTALFMDSVHFPPTAFKFLESARIRIVALARPTHDIVYLLNVAALACSNSGNQTVYASVNKRKPRNSSRTCLPACY
jgi:hypothetical protein